jgi:CRP-like cAMP-binding protein
MNHDDVLYQCLNALSPVHASDFALSDGLWKKRDMEKGEMFNTAGQVCKSFALVKKGLFRIYYIDPGSLQEVNLFFFLAPAFMVSLKSFTAQIPCQYHMEAMEDSELVEISYTDLTGLYSASHAWERFGRIVAEHSFLLNQMRTESLLFLSAEARYLQFLHLQPELFNRVPLYHLSSYLGIRSPSLSRIRKRLSQG